MNIRFYIFFSLLLSITVFNYSFAHELNEKKINSLIKKYIVDNPKLIEDTLKKLNQDRSVKNFKSALNDLKEIPNPKLINKKANITIYEFFDYNCGYCKKSLDAIRELLRSEYDLKISFRDYPILSPSSRIAAAAALAAKEQGKYFLFHSALMNLQGNLDENKIYSTAENLEIDIVKLKEDMNKPEIKKILEENEELARKLNIRGTPTFLINGKLYAGALELSKLKAIINQSLEDS